ncbi:hypothetical protein, partial [Corynebacterium stationis]|uniref:hypothetical protein n=1 Tax=Corynebacterium stationis TaxID=1705 RepID=UPI00263B8CF1
MSNFKPMTSQEAHDLLYGKYEMEDDSDPMIRPYSKEEGWVVQMGEDSYTNDIPNAPYEDAKLLAHAERALRTIMEMGKKLTTANDARKAHELLDELDARAELSQEQEELLRSFLPELPKQKTLEEILEEVKEVWGATVSSYWPEDAHGSLETWLWELHKQLEGLASTDSKPSQASPRLPEGMRLATHPEYGLCVVSPTTDEDGERRIFYLSAGTDAGADCR